VHFSLADLAADIAQNSAESGASLVRLEIREIIAPGNRHGVSVGASGQAEASGQDGASGQAGVAAPAKEEFRFIAGDNGKGMSGAGLDRAMDPFVTDGVKHPERKVGLGLPFLIQTAIQSGGGWRIISATADGEWTVRSGGIGTDGITGKDSAGKGGADTGGKVAGVHSADASGTTVEAWFDLVNVDTPPVGDIPGLFRTVLLFSGPEEIVLKRSRKGGNAELDYEVKKTELIEALGGDLEDVSSLVLLGQYLKSLEGEEDK